MSRKIIIAVMVLIAIVVGLKVFISNRNSVSTDDKILQASKYYETIDYDKTIAIYSKILLNDSSCAEAYIVLTDAYDENGNKDKFFNSQKRIKKIYCKWRIQSRFI